VRRFYCANERPCDYVAKGAVSDGKLAPARAVGLAATATATATATPSDLPHGNSVASSSIISLYCTTAHLVMVAGLVHYDKIMR
jgi:hypothetical protein